MTKQDFIQYLSHPEKLNGHSIAALEKLVREYPYFQLGRMLYLKNLHNQNSIDYEKNLHVTSAYAPSGKVLYNLIKRKSQEIQVDSRQYTVDNQQPKQEILPKMEAIAILEEMKMNVMESNVAKDEYDELEILEKEMLREAYRTSMTIDLLEEKTDIKSQIADYRKPITDNLHSFGDWMKVMSGKTPESVKEEKALQRKAKSNIIDNFILDQTARSEPRPRVEFYSAENMAKKSIEDNETFVSETLARIYMKQGNLPKALKAYEILLVKHPEKLHIFAPLLEKIKKLLKDQNNK